MSIHLQKALKDYTEARRYLSALVEREFPIGSWASWSSGSKFAGRVQCYDEESADLVWMLLEHGDTRPFGVDELTPCAAPAWAKELS